MKLQRVHRFLPPAVVCMALTACVEHSGSAGLSEEGLVTGESVTLRPPSIDSIIESYGARVNSPAFDLTEGNDAISLGPELLDGRTLARALGGNDIITATGAGTDVLVHGNGGNDTITVALPTESLFASGGQGDDILTGGGESWLFGNLGDDRLDGGGGWSGAADALFGGQGQDTLLSNSQVAFMSGDRGNDTYVIGSTPERGYVAGGFFIVNADAGDRVVCEGDWEQFIGGFQTVAQTPSSRIANPFRAAEDLELAWDPSYRSLAAFVHRTRGSIRWVVLTGAIPGIECRTTSDLNPLRGGVVTRSRRSLRWTEASHASDSLGVAPVTGPVTTSTSVLFTAEDGGLLELTTPGLQPRAAQACISASGTPVADQLARLLEISARGSAISFAGLGASGAQCVATLELGARGVSMRIDGVALASYRLSADEPSVVHTLIDNPVGPDSFGLVIGAGGEELTFEIAR